MFFFFFWGMFFFLFFNASMVYSPAFLWGFLIGRLIYVWVKMSSRLITLLLAIGRWFQQNWWLYFLTRSLTWYSWQITLIDTVLSAELDNSLFFTSWWFIQFSMNWGFIEKHRKFTCTFLHRFNSCTIFRLKIISLNFIILFFVPFILWFLSGLSMKIYWLVLAALYSWRW